MIWVNSGSITLLTDSRVRARQVQQLQQEADPLFDDRPLQAVQSAEERESLSDRELSEQTDLLWHVSHSRARDLRPA